MPSPRPPDTPAARAGLTALTAAVPAAWGTTYLVTTELLPPGQPLASGVLRALPAGLVLLAATRTLPRGHWAWRALALGTLNIGALFALLFAAAYRLPGGVAATLTAVQPLAAVALAFALLGERPTAWRLGWALAGIAGVALVVGAGPVPFDPVGVAAGIGAAVCLAAGIVLTKRWGRPEGVGPTAFAAWQLTAGGLVLLPLALAVEGVPSGLAEPRAVAGYLWLGVVGAGLSYPLWFNGIGRLPVVAVSFLPLLSPVVAAALGGLLLGEELSGSQGAGFALALAAVAAAQLDPRLRPRRGAPELPSEPDHRAAARPERGGAPR
ncbi:EamA family transporter [Nocardiopsis sp. RSe5-2]|uniref:EamA family transporter n=1 Tax=Nocardiopsis endophytica TaxID=3018445 RepID=A0ABT4UE34_9ACTN|nr:EamA family transporter [Nocardiopsis endophytica]MDA2815244.1 EamA family transporter [Nocardiopsis endophytica]